jgi:serine/threonine-protein kinase
LKRLRPGLAGDLGQRRRFRDEAALHAQLRHPAIVGFIDYIEHEGAPCLVLDHVDGLDASALAGGSVPEVVALHVVKTIAEALAHVHELRDPLGGPRAIVHRDVGPHNVRIGWAGDPLLLDFSIAVARERAARTPTGLAHGTPAFMAPEQLLRGRVDHRADLFSLGCLLAWLVGGKSPIDDARVRARFLHGDELELDAGALGACHAIVARATRLARDERHVDAHALAAELDGLLATRHGSDGRAAARAFMGRQREQAAGGGAGGGMLDAFLTAAPPEPRGE